MNKMLAALVAAVAAVTMGFTSIEAEAKRLGGGRPAGMQRQAPPKPADATPATPAQQATGTTSSATPATAAAAAPAGAAAGAAAQAAGKRSWLGPVAAIAAGVGLAALLSHLGMGETMITMITMLLLGIVAFVAIRWLMSRFMSGGARGTPAFQGAGAGSPSQRSFDPGHGQRQSSPEQAAPMQRASLASAAHATPGAHTGSMPADFDAEAFERIAKMIFIRLQAANDSGHVEDLRKFTTPELFASLRLDLQERGQTPQQTDVLQLEAQVVEMAREDDQWIVSVRFSGLIREASESAAEPFNELWHLVKPVDESREWAIAGITPQN